MAQHKASSRRASKEAPQGVIGKVFTLEHANRSITYVSRVVADLVAAHAKTISEQGAMQAANPGTSERSGHQIALTKASERLHQLADELKAVGVEIKDQAAGIIEFPSRHNRQPASLIWQLGQSQISLLRVSSVGPTLPIQDLDERE